jgi:hypothetical protein
MLEMNSQTSECKNLRLNGELGEELGSYGQELYDLCRHVGHGPVA